MAGSQVYTFTPNADQCATTAPMTVTVNDAATPSFTQVQPVCSGANFTLPTTSDNGITGVWSPAINNMMTTTYTFTPNAALHPCAATEMMTVTVNANTTPTFTQVQPICSGGSFTLPTLSNNGIAGTWSPAINNMMTTTYTFTPNAALHPCAATEMMTVTVNANTTPTFTQVQPICSGGSFSLPPVSNEGISGAWTPAINNTTTTTYTFTPTAGQCATTQTMTVTVNANPVANIPVPFEVCVLLIPPTLLSENSAVVLSQITGGNPGLTVNWFFDAAATMPIPNINNVFLAIPPPTTVYATVSNGSCSSSTVPVGIVISQPPVINAPNNVSACQSYTLPPITGANLTGNEAYYTGPNGTGTQYLPGQVISSTVTLFAYAGSGMCADQEQFTITITPPPTANPPGAPLSICDNGAGIGQFNLTNLDGIISGGSGTVNWFTDAGATNPIANPSAFVSGATTVYATVTVGICTSSPVPLVLQLTPGPAANPAGPLQACDNGAGLGLFPLSNLNGLISGGSGTVSWFSDAGTSISIPNPNAHVSGGGTVYAVVSLNGCNSVPVPVSLIINPLPVVNLTVAQAISCAASANGAISTGIGNATGPFTFDWNINALDGQQNPANLGPGTYSVIVTATNTGCIGTGSITLSAPTAITLNCAQQNPVSTPGGSDGSATVQISGGTAAYTVAWSGAASGTQNQAAAGAATITGLIAGAYNVVVTDANGCTQSCSFTVDAPNCPPISSPGIAVPTATICAGAAIPAFTASVPAGLTVIWYDAATGGTVLLINSLSFTPTMAGTYFAEAFDPVTGCRSATRTPVVLTINPTQTPTFTQVQPICAGGSFSLPATSDNGIAGTWSPAVNNMATTTYTFTPNAAVHPCAVTTTMTVTVNPTQTPTFTQVQPICAGGSFSLPATSDNGIAGIWSPAVNNMATTTYTFTPNAAVHPCAVTTTMTVTVNPIQTPAFTQVQPICAGGSFSLPATSDNGIAGTWSPAVNNMATTTYTFTPNATAHPCAVQATMAVQVDAQPTLTIGTVALAPGLLTYSVNFTATGGTVSTTAGTISGSTVTGIPTGTNVTITVSNGTNTACDVSQNVTSPNCNLSATAVGTDPGCNGAASGSIALTVTGGTGTLTFDWNDNTLDGTEDPSGLSAGTYSVTVTDGAGCTANAATTLTNPAALSFAATGIAANCFDPLNGSISVTLAGGGVPPYEVSYDGLFFSGIGALPAQIAGVAPGNYTVTLQDANDCMIETQVTVLAAPTYTLDLGPDLFVRLGDSVRLEGAANFAIDSVVWTPTEFLNDISGPVTFARPSVSTAYQLVAFDENGCRVEDEVWVYVERRLDIFIPNAFSPNDDGINDKFRVFGDNKVTIIRSLRVFDRWGGNVFGVTDVMPDDSAAGWDGSHRGQKLNAGVYLYVAEIEFFDGHVETVMGEVTLLR
ncbi:MAG: gliding motility-associated C-terminal domain-containing protein [Saprospiraceae bacterium]|nr:gliding motility-associated C-terminal domain-containing protein [Saprospiraceae bacterium]